MKVLPNMDATELQNDNCEINEKLHFSVNIITQKECS
jgi:hypothetical protein